jgi:hypothetical protein
LTTIKIKLSKIRPKDVFIGIMGAAAFLGIAGFALYLIDKVRTEHGLDYYFTGKRVQMN